MGLTFGTGGRAAAGPRARAHIYAYVYLDAPAGWILRPRPRPPAEPPRPAWTRCDAESTPPRQVVGTAAGIEKKIAPGFARP